MVRISSLVSDNGFLHSLDEKTHLLLQSRNNLQDFTLPRNVVEAFSLSGRYRLPAYAAYHTRSAKASDNKFL
jgi:hypothetical protein